jgi:anti-anti-sigma regulatory factor
MTTLMITKTEMQGRIGILHLQGKLDASNHESLLAEAQKVHESGFSNLILDLGNLSFISSSGLAAMHQVALLFHGDGSAEDDCWGEYRWKAFRSENRGNGLRVQKHVKLSSPTREVKTVLEMIGFMDLFEIFSDLSLAVASFGQAVPVEKVNQD